MNLNDRMAPAPKSVTDDLNRLLLIWLSGYTDIPALIKPEPMLAAKETGLELTTIRNSLGPPDITGGHREGEYQFGIIYRIVSPKGADARLEAIQDLNRLGDYAISTTPDLGDKINFLECAVAQQAALLYPYENGDEDYQILLKLTYEVI